MGRSSKRDATAAASAPAGSAAASSAHADHKKEPTLSWFVAMTTYMGYATLIMFGHLRDFFGKLTGMSRYFNVNSRPQKGYAPLLQDWENFYTRRLYHRIQDCWNRPIAGPPTGARLKVVLRKSDDGNRTLHPDPDQPPRECLNLGSYNYLGFADEWQTACRGDVMSAAEANPLSLCTSPGEGGYTAAHRKLEQVVAGFVGKPACMIFNMGYATNALGIPALLGTPDVHGTPAHAGKGCLIISDSLNHASIVNGARASGATIRVFKHNDADNLEALLRQAIVDGQERTHRPWRKIIVCVEGIYSMEGDICRLPDIVRVTKRYKAYLYLDEAHSIGAMGATGRGICEHTGVNPADVDILMGTFTKSFGAMGGYIAGSEEVIAALRSSTAGFLQDNAMAPAVCQQILTAFRVIMDEDRSGRGPAMIARLKSNANFFRGCLKRMGVEIVGDDDSPIIPLMLYNPTKIAAFSRECLARGLAVVVVGFPATPVLLSRTRFCVSAGHTLQDLERAAEKIAEVVETLRLRYDTHVMG